MEEKYQKENSNSQASKIIEGLIWQPKKIPSPSLDKDNPNGLSPSLELLVEKAVETVIIQVMEPVEADHCPFENPMLAHVPHGNPKTTDSSCNVVSALHFLLALATNILVTQIDSCATTNPVAKVSSILQ
ncbi:hypothetical protein ACH5RR_018243 [Cinchona calisaya]|uniref:Uncharacterized protein n=1 Tax=Cinchona calisaya TaxID=153742 RepID=A0ABD2ZKU9_9GENT